MKSFYFFQIQIRPINQLDRNPKSNFLHKELDGETPFSNTSSISELVLHNSSNDSIRSNSGDVKDTHEEILNNEIRLLRKVMNQNSRKSNFPLSNPSPTLIRQNSQKTNEMKNCLIKGKTVFRRAKSEEACSNNSSLSHNQLQMSRLKVRTEKSAIILGLIVVLFIFTHCYRIAMKIYEVALPSSNTTEHFQVCFALRR